VGVDEMAAVVQEVSEAALAEAVAKAGQGIAAQLIHGNLQN
jgi:hypothetical protein